LKFLIVKFTAVLKCDYLTKNSVEWEKGIQVHGLVENMVQLNLAPTHVLI